MTSLLTTRADKDRALHTIAAVFEQFLFHGLAPRDIAKIAEHFTWMREQADDLKVNARLETFPETQTTRITLDLSFAAEVAPFKVPQ